MSLSARYSAGHKNGSGHLHIEEQKMLPKKAESSSSDDETDSSDDRDSETDNNRWDQPNSLEMDCVWLVDDKMKDESALPQIFDLEAVFQQESRFCMLCSEIYGNFLMRQKKNCRRCGKSVCESCSKASRRLSQID